MQLLFSAVVVQIVVVLLAITIYNVPLFLEWKVTEYYHHRRHVFVYRKRKTDMAQTDSYSIFYRIALLYLMLYVIPVGLLAVMSYQLIVTVKRVSSGNYILMAVCSIYT